MSEKTIGPYTLDIEPFLKAMAGKEDHRVLLQLPDGLRPYTEAIIE